MVIRLIRTYTQSVEGYARNQFTDTIRHAFNALALAHVRAGGKATPMMEMDGKIHNYKVTALKEKYAILEDSDGETYGMVWNEI